MSRAGRAFGSVALSLTLFLISGGAALAAEVTITVSAPEQVAVGDTVQVQAFVASGGAALSGAEVALSYQESFAGVSRRVVLDREKTDENGVAVFEYEQRAETNGEMRVSYVGPDDLNVAPAVFTIDVAPGGERQYQPDVGVEIWWLSGWWLIVIIMLVWAMIVYSAFQLVLVSKRGGKVPLGPTLRSEEGSSYISMALWIAAIITAVGMVVVFVRNPLTHGNILGSEGYDRTPVAYVGNSQPYLGPGLADPSLADTGDPVNDGSILFYGYGCAECHGLSGTGGVVGPDLEDEVGSLGNFIEDVREGPGGMPAYPVEVLSDDDLAKIHAFLKSLGG